MKLNVSVETAVEMSNVIVELSRRNDNQAELIQQMDDALNELRVENKLLRHGITPGPSPELQRELDALDG